MGIYDKLTKYSQSGNYPFHMPGHKRIFGNFCNPYEIDITEIDGFDDLNHPDGTGILSRSQEEAAELFGAEETHYLVNGSTAGILSAVFACAKKEGSLLIARNCHKSVYNAAELAGLKLHYLYPVGVTADGVNGPVNPVDVLEALDSPAGREGGGKPCAVVITSPTYDGVCSDVREISRICHMYGVPLIVDQAHGAHFAFSGYFPEDAVSSGADLVIQSLHKTLPALTQTGLLHISGSLADRELVRRYLTVFQTSSPSYVLMASIDSCIGLLKIRGGELFDSYTDRLEAFRRECLDLQRLKIMNLCPRDDDACPFKMDFDRSRLIIATGGMIPGPRLMEELRRRFRIETEMSAPGYVLGISSVADTEEGFQKLKEALFALDRELIGEESPECLEKICRNADSSAAGEKQGLFPYRYPVSPRSAMAPFEARLLRSEGRLHPLEDAPGHMCLDYIYLYPPGTPLAVPGEVLTEETARMIKDLLDQGYTVQGIRPCADGGAHGKAVLCDR